MCPIQNITTIFYYTFFNLRVLILHPKSLILYRNEFLCKFAEFSPILPNPVNYFRKDFWYCTHCTKSSKQFMHFGTICTFGGIICNHLLFTFVFCFYRLPCTQKIQAPPVRRFADRWSLLYHFYSVSVSLSPANSSSVVPCNLTNTLLDNSSKYETSKYGKAHSIYYMTLCYKMVDHIIIINLKIYKIATEIHQLLLQSNIAALIVRNDEKFILKAAITAEANLP